MATAKPNTIRIGGYGIARDPLNWILYTYGEKERWLKDGEVPGEVIKSTSFFSSLENLVNRMHDEEMIKAFEQAIPLKEIALKGVTRLVAQIATAEAESA